MKILQFDPSKGSARQGDVLITREKDAPADWAAEEPQELTVLAYGEVTGHAHFFEKPGVTTLFKDSISDRIMKLPEINLLRHGTPPMAHDPDHYGIQVPPGVYRIRRQVEYSKTTMSRRVTD